MELERQAKEEYVLPHFVVFLCEVVCDYVLYLFV